MADLLLNNEIKVVIEQYENGVLFSRRVPVHYLNLPNALCNQINILLSEGIDAGIIAEIEAMRDSRAELLGQMNLIEQVEPLIQSRRVARMNEYFDKKKSTPPGQAK
jgi:hypothetical protein